MPNSTLGERYCITYQKGNGKYASVCPDCCRRTIRSTPNLTSISYLRRVPDVEIDAYNSAN